MAVNGGMHKGIQLVQSAQVLSTTWLHMHDNGACTSMSVKQLHMCMYSHVKSDACAPKIVMHFRTSEAACLIFTLHTCMPSQLIADYHEGDLMRTTLLLLGSFLILSLHLHGTLCNNMCLLLNSLIEGSSCSST